MWRAALASVPDDLTLALEGSYYYLRVSAYEHLQEVSPGELALEAFAEVHVLAFPSSPTGYWINRKVAAAAHLLRLQAT